MPKLPPSGYIPAAVHAVGFAKRMKGYEKKVEEEKRRQQENEAEAKVKVKPLIKVKP